MDDKLTPSDTALEIFINDIKSDNSIKKDLIDSLLRDINSGSFNLPDLNITIASLIEGDENNASD
ncbi:MAG: hypothetical protein IIA06_11565 [Proteobacteria bacterium]|nr:hypothetical protein [Pseudomonadota bacterium]